MGSPFAPANISIYEDDIVAAFDKEQDSLNFLDKKHPNINFTKEKQINHSIAFLDVFN